MKFLVLRVFYGYFTGGGVKLEAFVFLGLFG